MFNNCEKTDARWKSLTEEEKAWQNDWLMCCSMYGAINCNENGDAFSCSCATGEGIGELQNRMVEFFKK